MFGTKIMSKKTRGTGKSPISPSPLATPIGYRCPSIRSKFSVKKLPTQQSIYLFQLSDKYVQLPHNPDCESSRNLLQGRNF